MPHLTYIAFDFIATVIILHFSEGRFIPSADERMGVQVKL